jgi:uncharacterized membrane protein YhaH (DUF805 family)
MEPVQMDSAMAASQSGGGAGMVVMGLIELALAVLMIASMWKIFTKAGMPGWGALIPFYNLYLLCKVCGKSGWWVLLMFIPLVNFVIAILLMIELATSFGKGAGYAVGLILLGFVFLPMLAFGDAKYQRAPAT